MGSIIVCDIDGTLVSKTRVNVGLVRLLRVLSQEHPLLFLTGRIDESKTYQELHGRIALHGELHCRPHDRKREPPHLWKLEELSRINAEFSILMLIDDDPKMQQGAKALGIAVL